MLRGCVRVWLVSLLLHLCTPWVCVHRHSKRNNNKAAAPLCPYQEDGHTSLAAPVLFADASQPALHKSYVWLDP
jgi:hypothetical protein